MNVAQVKRLGALNDAWVVQWEPGLKKPHGPALRLLELADQMGLEAIA